MGEILKVAKSWSTEMRKGYGRLAILMLLSRESLTGYDIIKLIEKKTKCFWRLTPGGIYPNLRKLERKGYVKGHWESKGGRRKRLYTITDEGKRLLEVALRRQQQMAETIGELFREFAKEFLGTELTFLDIAEELSFPLLGENLEGKPIDEQIDILRRTRSKMCRAIKLIDERMNELVNNPRDKERRR